MTCSGHTTLDGGALRHAPLRLLDLESLCSGRSDQSDWLYQVRPRICLVSEFAIGHGEILSFQPVKCNLMQLTNKQSSKIQANYTLEGTLLENVESIKYLGVTITNNLKWNTHISYVCTKANRTL